MHDNQFTAAICAACPQASPAFLRAKAPAAGKAAPKGPKGRKSHGNAVFAAFLSAAGLPAPIAEYQFHPTRRWRLDYCWRAELVALEVQGGIFRQGRHTRGTALLAEWEKLNTAAGLGYRFIFVQPRDLCTAATASFLRAALKAP